MATPTAAVIILNHNGRQHLAGCLPAVLALRDLAGPGAVVVADNGSTDGSVEWLARNHPEVRRLTFDENLGFAAGNDRAAAEVDAEYVLFLNNDTTIHHDALANLLEAVQAGAACAGARLVSWDGLRLDFDGGGASLTGHGHALGYGSPHAAVVESTAGRRSTAPAGLGDGGLKPTLFTSGAAMLVRRQAFLDLGGFDPSYFAYYEDVDLGWRLNLAGQRVVQVPRAVVRHRHGGTAHAVRHRSGRLFERNALLTVAKNYDEVNLRRVLPAALALAAVRAGAEPGVIDSAARLAEGAVLPLPRPDWPGWPFLAPLALDWPAVASSRSAVQARRLRSDAQVLPLLARAYAPVPPDRRGWRALAQAVRVFGLDEVFGPWQAPLAVRLRYGV